MRPVLAGVCAAVLLLCTASAGAQQPSGGWDGSNPFRCTLQNVGFGTAYPQPDADPFCVEFDKRRQNVTELGVVEFASQEPARVAAASPKCFYFQTDHWRGSIVQDNAATETYNYDGSYFFDKARGAGGVAVKNFRVAGQQGDPTAVPGFPAEYRPYFGKGKGGFQYAGGGIDVEPRCVELAKRKAVYAPPGSKARCRLAGGRIGRGIGGIRLRNTRAGVRAALGAPTSESRFAVRYCLEGGGTLSAGFLAVSPRRRAVIVQTDHPAFTYRGIAVGESERSARRSMRRERVRRRRDGTRLLISRGRHRTLVVAARRGRVAWIAVARPKLKIRILARDLRRVN
jgi:hypothetical protein